MLLSSDDLSRYDLRLSINASFNALSSAPTRPLRVRHARKDYSVSIQSSCRDTKHPIIIYADEYVFRSVMRKLTDLHKVVCHSRHYFAVSWSSYRNKAASAASGTYRPISACISTPITCPKYCTKYPQQHPETYIISSAAPKTIIACTFDRYQIVCIVLVLSDRPCRAAILPATRAYQM